MRRAERARDCDPAGKPEPLAKGEDAGAEALLAAEQMRDTGQIDVQAIVGGGRDRRPMPDGVQREPIERGMIGRDVCRAHVEFAD